MSAEDNLSPNQTDGSSEALVPLKAYLISVCPPVLNGTKEGLESALSLKENEEILRIFASDTLTSSLFIHRHVVGEGKENERESYVFELQMRPSKSRSQNSTALALVKVSPTIDGSSPIARQLHLCQLSDDAVSESLLQYVRHCFLPYYRSAADSDAKDADVNAVKNVNRKLNELEVELLRFQENVEVPLVHFEVHRAIVDFVRDQKSKKGKLDVSEFGALATDIPFINELQASLAEWKKNILKVTKQTRDVSSGTLLQEVNFWLSMERVVDHIYEQKDSPEVGFLFTLLNHNKRFIATTGFMQDAGLAATKADDRVHRIANFLRELPIKKVLSAVELSEVRRAIEAIYQYLLNNKTNEYLRARASSFNRTLRQDLLNQVLSILRGKNLLNITYNDMASVVMEFEQVHQTFTKYSSDFLSSMRDQAHHPSSISNLALSNKKNPLAFYGLDMGAAARSDAGEFRSLYERLQTLIQIRQSHEELKKIVDETFASDSYMRNNAVAALQQAYACLKECDILSLSADGNEAFQAALKNYHAKISEIEAEFEEKITQLLNAAKGNAREMFRVCAIFNPLFSRPRIKNAISRHQEQLLASVREDIKRLMMKFESGFSTAEAKKMSRVRDLERLSSNVMWARQIRRQLDLYVGRIVDVLGPHWASSPDALTLVADIDKLKKLTDTDSLLEEWQRPYSGEKSEDLKKMQPKGPLFKLVQSQRYVSLAVNLSPEGIRLYKEVRTLHRLAKMNYSLIDLSEQIALCHPHSVRLGEALTCYRLSSSRLATAPFLAPLVSSAKREVQDWIRQSFKKQIDWQSLEVGPYAVKLSELAVKYQDLVDDVLAHHAKALQSIEALKTCACTFRAFHGVLSEIQGVVDHLIDKKCDRAGVSKYASLLDNKIESILCQRLANILTVFEKAVEYDPNEEQKKKPDDEEEEEKKPAESEAENSAASLSINELLAACNFRHDIVLRNASWTVEPPLQRSRLALIEQLNRWISVICDLPRVRFVERGVALESGDAEVSREDKTYRSVLSRLQTGIFERVLRCINNRVRTASLFVEQWLKYQSLWDLDIDKVAQFIGTDLAKWQQLMLDFKRSRATTDSKEASKSFGPIVIEFGGVQTKVTTKYDNWQRMLLNKLGSLLGESLTSTFANVRQAREKLEKCSLDFSTTSVMIETVTLITSLQQQKQQLGKLLATQKEVESSLQRQRYFFPADWLYVERVQGEFSALDQLLSRMLAKLQEEMPVLQQRLSTEELLFEQKIKDFLADWKKQRPLQGDLPHTHVVNTLSMFDSALTRLEEESSKLNQAKKVLEMPWREETRIQPVKEELNGLKEVWSYLSNFWQQLEQLGEKYFKDVKTTDLRKQLTQLQQECLRLPAHMRTYEAVDFFKNRVKDLLSMNVFLSDLQASTLRLKHQKEILVLLSLQNVVSSWSDLLISHLWQVDFFKYSKQLRHVLEQAQGESALEEFLAELSGTWQRTMLEVVDYKQGKCFLIRNWEPLFAALSDHLSSIQAMKQSPFFKSFETEAQQWEQRLNQAQSILDVFIDVQRRWVYLEGIFNNSADVQQQLNTQYRKFRTFDADFIRLMRDIHREPLLSTWVREEKQLLVRLEQYAEVLNSIQKALGDYLEKQRSSFPRFYFVGDEDLLEIIGNARAPLKVMRHLPKMFAGIESLMLSEDQKQILGMSSKEGERVPFSSPIVLTESTAVHEWLGAAQAQMRYTLALLLEKAIDESQTFFFSSTNSLGDAEVLNQFFAWCDRFPAQIVLLASQTAWTSATEAALRAAKESKADASSTLQTVSQSVEDVLQRMAERILSPDLTAEQRNKYEQLITELVHQRDVVRQLIDGKVKSDQDFGWLGHMRYYFDRHTLKHYDLKSACANDEIPQCLQICIARSKFYYGFEYLGAQERLVQTPLTDRVYLTLCEALHMRLGGNPFGPAGTGKTETVKALGSQLGRFVLVFNCDENFDFQAMGRIFVGLCQTGAWGCFDEFNRLEERILSAVSQQILNIQVGLKQQSSHVSLLGKQVKLNPRVGLFVTMNPGYAGRSNLPDNLKQLFRGIAMIQPNKMLIAQVMLFSQGFATAEALSSKIVLLFQLCQEQLSSQSHYDFGLRALKSVLRTAGNMKRASIRTNEKNDASLEENELKLLVQSMCSTLVPKLIAEDVFLFDTLLKAVFPGFSVTSFENAALRVEISRICKEKFYRDEELWVEKIMQLQEILQIAHGVILVGPSSSGKTAAWQTLAAALERVEDAKERANNQESKEKAKIRTYVVDPKAINKEELYGKLDPTTLEWTDGVFTHILRKIVDNVRNEQKQKHWIIFDGDVDPEWAENLNSVLDDNKLLTLPNGERLALPPNVRLIFEVSNLNFATPATVSRCGMVWFSENVVSNSMMLAYHARLLRDSAPESSAGSNFAQRMKQVQLSAFKALAPLFGVVNNQTSSSLALGPSASAQTDSSVVEIDASTSFVLTVLDYIMQRSHIMEFSRARALSSLFSLLRAGLNKIMDYNDSHMDFPLQDKQIEAYMTKYLVLAIMWAFGGSMSLRDRLNFCKELANMTTSVQLPDISVNSLIDYDVKIDTQDWQLWEDSIAMLELESHAVIRSDVVIETVDTVRHTSIISSWLQDHRPMLLCGPPGSGKSMTLTSVLRALPHCELVTLNFSSTTGPELIHRTLAHYCKTEKTPNGLVMRPQATNKWLVIFCDEINLPATDKYKTQTVITFLRQLIEQGGFWRASDLQFVRLENIQIVGACNPPTDAGRVPMTPRFLRHCPLVFVDFPARPSLKQIYGTFNRALLKLVPNMRTYWEPLTEAMIDVYEQSQQRFTPDVQPHYIYSPRELSRWVRAMYEALRAAPNGELRSIELDELVRLWVHEALRLFQDRLVEKAERQWTDEIINKVALDRFPGIDRQAVLQRPVLFSNWLSKFYSSVTPEALRQHVQNRLRVFYEEQLDVKLVIFDEVLEHILRIDRVLRQPLGHLLLVGSSGAGKTILSRFVAWMNGMSTFQIKVHKNYSAKDFDKDLREVLTRAGCKDEKICFIFDESNVLSTAFLERMNALLAGGEVPGLFEGPDLVNLLAECREAAKKDNVNRAGESDDELFRYFTQQVQRNLHVVFTMNPSNDDFDNRSATSPALFNRCVIDWFGEWSPLALYQVGYEFTKNLDLGDGVLAVDGVPEELDEETLRAKRAVGATPGSQRDAIVQTMVFIHQSVGRANTVLASQRGGRASYVTPRHYLDLIKHYANLFHEKRSALEDQQRHLRTGLKKLKDTEEQVKTLQQELKIKNQELEKKQKEANDKLEQMMHDKAKAEQQKQQSEILAKQTAEEEKKAWERRTKAEQELAGARPALEAAEAAVRNIKKADLDEVKGFNNPPAVVKACMEVLLMMLGESFNNWEGIRKILRGGDFVNRVLDFDITTVKPATREKIRKMLAEDPNLEENTVMKASKACGPLMLWLRSKIRFAEIKDSVAPLENELRQIEAVIATLKEKSAALQEMQEELGRKIDQYKIEYSALVTEVERIKAEMSSVKTKVDRSTALLANLNVERERWEADKGSFAEQMATVVGDCLLAAAFVAYLGYFNQAYRQMLLDAWSDRIRSSKIKFNDNLSLVDYLSTPSERLAWQAANLPQDNLCVENAIMCTRFNRYPLLIDPSGQAADFLLKHMAHRNIVRTSFLDDGFMKQLESALRFGTALLVDDVEALDPMLNSVLNREITKQGGRVMVTLGDKEIDFSPSFVIFMVTRDPAAHFTPDLCSRVTFVNFSVTPSSLQAQCLSSVLRAERKDIDEKRNDLLRLQGEFRLRLRQLEDSLLDALNAAKGNILDDDSVLTSLETLKQEASEVQRKVKESDEVMKEVESVSEQYRPFASACSSIYFSLDALADVHFLYQFSLPSFLSIVDSILFPSESTAVSQFTTPEEAELLQAKDPKQRLRLLTRILFFRSFARVQRSLLTEDQLGFALRLVQIALQDCDEVLFGQRIDVDVRELEFFMKGRVDMIGQAALLTCLSPSVSSEEEAVNKLPSSLTALLAPAQKRSLAQLARLNSFGRLLAHMLSNADEWVEFLQTSSSATSASHEEKEKDNQSSSPVPSGWEPASPINAALARLLICKALRPDLVPQHSSAFVTAVFGSNFLAPIQQQPSLQHITFSEATAQTPLLLVSKPGFDASSKVDALAAAQANNITYQSFAMGSPEGFDQALQAILAAAKKGSWILLKNVHLAPAWLTSLEKRLHRMQLHKQFRLFMTCEIHPKLPLSLLRMSELVLFEPAVGVKASLTRLFSGQNELFSAARLNRSPQERPRLFFLLCWLHAVILERLRYLPLGWSKGFEFSESDIACAVDALEEWLDKAAQQRANIAPSQIPWGAIQATLESVAYGGRIDNDHDQARLQAFVRSLFRPESYELNFSLVDGSASTKNAIVLPDINTYEQFRQFIESLPDVMSPEMIGLPANADLLLAQRQGERLSHILMQIQDTQRDSDASSSLHSLMKFEELDVDLSSVQGSLGSSVSSPRSSSSSLASSEDSSAAVSPGQRPQWMLVLAASIKQWQKLLPTVDKFCSSNVLAVSSAASAYQQNPVFRCLQREFRIWKDVLSLVQHDLEHALGVMEGTAKGSNAIREVFMALRKENIPPAWQRVYPPLQGLSPVAFINDLARRCQQMQELVALRPDNYSTKPIWLGGLYAPEAFVAATRQAVAQAHSWPLDHLHLDVSFQDSPANADSFMFQGLNIHSATIENNVLSLATSAAHSTLPTACFTWHLSESHSDASFTSVPCYLDDSRSHFLLNIRLKRPAEEQVAATTFVKRGVCLSVWSDQDASNH